MNQGNILITGGTSGLGFELAKQFCAKNYDVWITGRSLKAGLPAGMKLHFLRADFADLRQTEKAVKELLSQGVRFDIVVNNAGILGPPEYKLTKDGFESTFQTNFLAHLLVNESIISSADPGSEIVLAIVTSPVYRYVRPTYILPREDNYESFEIYAASKYYLLIMGDFLKKEHSGKKVRLVKFNPGVFSSGIYRMRQRWFHVLYGIAVRFMRSPAKPARLLFELILNEGTSDDRVYRSIKSGGKPAPVLTDKAEEFLFSCQHAVEVVR